MASNKDNVRMIIDTSHDPTNFGSHAEMLAYLYYSGKSIAKAPSGSGARLGTVMEDMLGIDIVYNRVNAVQVKSGKTQIKNKQRLKYSDIAKYSKSFEIFASLADPEDPETWGNFVVSMYNKEEGTFKVIDKSITKPSKKKGGA